MWNMFKINNKETQRSRWRRFAVFIVDFEKISNLFLVFRSFNLSMNLFAG